MSWKNDGMDNLNSRKYFTAFSDCQVFQLALSGMNKIAAGEKPTWREQKAHKEFTDRYHDIVVRIIIYLLGRKRLVLQDTSKDSIHLMARSVIDHLFFVYPPSFMGKDGEEINQLSSTYFIRRIKMVIGFAAPEVKGCKSVVLLSDQVCSKSGAPMEGTIHETRTQYLPEENLEVSTAVAKLRELILRLRNNKQREALNLQLDGYSCHEIAERLDVSYANATKLVSDAKKGVRELAQRLGILSLFYTVPEPP